MQPFKSLNAVAAPMPMVNVDTDMIIPKQFLRTIKRTGLGKHLFSEMRYEADGAEKPDFVLNKPAYRNAQILIADDNFGCGSSREHAPWALADFGIRCVIAPSFADIFHGNAFKNGMCPVVLPREQVQALMQRATDYPDQAVAVDLEKQEVRAGNLVFSFEIDPFRRHCLLNGLDDIGLTLEHESDIAAYESNLRKNQPWNFA
ncbi:MAG: 3-isopropylmalate dehydratase small subunit [Rhodospirillales bacterium]|nr:MAG: 3-isopropylmalate dehydratase small subunit [Rhodospirillales bacterium]